MVGGGCSAALSTSSSWIRTSILVERGLVFRTAVGRIIVRTPAEVLVADHQRARALRRAHAAREGQLFGTLIHHARRCAFAQTKLAITITMIRATMRGLLVASS